MKQLPIFSALFCLSAIGSEAGGAGVAVCTSWVEQGVSCRLLREDFGPCGQFPGGPCHSEYGGRIMTLKGRDTTTLASWDNYHDPYGWYRENLRCFSWDSLRVLAAIEKIESRRNLSKDYKTVRLLCWDLCLGKSFSKIINLGEWASGPGDDLDSVSFILAADSMVAFRPRGLYLCFFGQEGSVVYRDETYFPSILATTKRDLLKSDQVRTVLPGKPAFCSLNGRLISAAPRKVGVLGQFRFLVR